MGEGWNDAGKKGAGMKGGGRMPIVCSWVVVVIHVLLWAVG